MAKYTPVTYWAIILDRSGSMGTVRGQAIESHNQQLRDVRNNAEGQDVRVIRTVFDYPDAIDISEPMPLVEVSDLDFSTYEPRGSTALNDAIGKTVLKLRGYKLRKKDAVLVTIITDGEENSSVQFDGTEVKKMVEDAESTGQWTVTFLGANVDPFTVSSSYGINLSNVATYTSSPTGWQNATPAMSVSNMNYFGARSRGETTSSTFYTTDDAPADFTEEALQESTT
jgi:uncharacterized protein YegL